jgi:two-component system, cell cycle sensor histidine kinase and response regulator CckA
MQQVLMNLVVNSGQAMPDGGTIRIIVGRCHVDADMAATHPAASLGDYVTLTVSDTGTGIPSEVIEMVFEPFFTTKAVGEGTGLGLSTVFAIIQDVDGFLTVSSTVNEGTSFCIYLPAETLAPLTQS